MHNGAPPNLVLAVCELSNIFLVSEMGVQDQQISPCEVLILIHIIPFCGVAPMTRSNDQNQEHLNQNNKFEIFLPLFILTS
jgi:hypothetical protein